MSGRPARGAETGPTTGSQYERTKNERDEEPEFTPRKLDRSGS